MKHHEGHKGRPNCQNVSENYLMSTVEPSLRLLTSQDCISMVERRFPRQRRPASHQFPRLQQMTPAQSRRSCKSVNARTLLVQIPTVK